MSNHMPFIYGINPVVEALRLGGIVRRLYIYKARRGRGVEDIVRLARAQGVEVEFVEKDFLKGLPKAHQGVIAEVRERLPCSLEDLYRITEARREPPFYIVVDSVEDPHNLGAILRVAEASGVHGVVLPKRRVAKGPTVTKAAAGADLHLCIIRTSNIKHCIKEFQKKNIRIIGLEVSGQQSLWEEDLTGPVACVIGSEGKGLRRTVLEACDTVVKIPLWGKITSLNVSTALAVFAFELRRQRGLK